MIKRLAHLIGIMMIALPVTGCAVMPPDFNAHAADDAALRHPIELRQGWQELILPLTRQLDARSRTQISDFVEDWRQSGGGPVYVRLPLLTRDEKLLREQFSRLRAALMDAGLSGPVKLIREPMGETARVPHFVVSFARMKAQVVTRCGRWPDNLASSAATGWDNRIHAEFGCAYQNMIAAQTADPRDLVAPHPQSAVDGHMRVRALSRLRGEEAGSASGGIRN